MECKSRSRVAAESQMAALSPLFTAVTANTYVKR